MTVTRVARLTEADWRVFAVVRLQALTDSLGPTDPQYRREASFTAAQWRRRLREHAAFTVLVDDRPMGLISAQHQSADSVYLYSLWLAPDARGHGLAGELLEAAVQWARSRQVHTVTLRVAPDNSVARGIYEKAGFRVAAATVGPRQELAMSLSV
ncbi:GNAT family N-acetyltransferase [Mycolicibacterium sp. S2-37]|uniref:GNAT family N-acetyltransferase n=1 Tax=Mycolicibacterium sp. S2-37 TaxID=2810297 RepID=UPI001A952363|nr:GNAT family N-acetyltransferase [Mycolicibacterium sp. S2-37]MBO0676478.1 GNAT family N-acetyltransferase [Mycolicibacterium sp. S2-37]